MLKTLISIAAALAAANFTAYAETPVAVTHRQFQAVNSDGTSAFAPTGPWRVSLEGILLNNPEDWLDPTPDPTVASWFMGGQWQVVIQGEGDDHAGTACWMGQNYKNGPGSASYTNEHWLAEIIRLNRDPATGYVFRAGDRVRVTGTYLFHGGKLNINENHQVLPEFDFTLELIKPGVGLPQPVEITLADLKHADNTEIFDPNRLTGGEYYQGRRVRIQNVTVMNPQNWGPNQDLTISDGQGRTFPVRLGIGQGISRYACPTGVVDVIGIMDQAAPGFPPDPTKGYRLVMLNYDGNGLVLGDLGNPRGNLPADVNGDHIVNLEDLALLAQNWLKSRAGLHLPPEQE